MAFTKTEYQPGDTLPAEVVTELINSVITLLNGGGSNSESTNAKRIQIIKHSDTGYITMGVAYDDDSQILHNIELDENKYPIKITTNDTVECDIAWEGFDEV